MGLLINLQIIREGTKYESYRISLPRDIIQAKGWERTKFILKFEDNKIILEPVNN